MESTTVVVTGPQNTLSNHLVLTLKRQNTPEETLSKEICELALDRLTLILNTYLSWENQDPLSRQLVNWCFEVIDLDFDLPESQTKLTQLIDILANEILINSLDRAPLLDKDPLQSPPLLVDGLIWENWMWEDFKNVCPHMITTKVHQFAVEMILWKNAWPFPQTEKKVTLSDSNSIFKSLQSMLANSSPHLNSTLLLSQNDPEAKLLKGYAYGQLVSNALTVQYLQTLRFEMEEGSDQLRQLWKTTSELICKESEVTKQKAELQSLRQKQILENIQEQHQHTVTFFQSRVVDLNQQLSETRNRIQALEQTSFIQESQIRELRVSFIQQLGAIRHLQHKAKKKHRWF